MWYRINVTRGSPPFFFLSDLRAWCVGEEEKGRRALGDGRNLGKTFGRVERERFWKDWRRGEISWRIEAWGDAMAEVLWVAGGCEVK